MNHKHADKGDASTDYAANRKTVLLVDDDTKLLRGLVRSLASEYDILTAVSAAEAGVMLARNDVDLIISDNLMTGVLGTDFLTSVRKTYPHIKLLMLSGYMPPAAARRVMEELGVERVLSKPCDGDEVAAAIRSSLGDTVPA